MMPKKRLISGIHASLARPDPWRTAEPLGFVELDRLFSRAEAQIDLLRRCEPENGPAALERWLQAFRRGQDSGFAWRHAQPPTLEPLRRALGQVQSRLLGNGPMAELYAQRAGELGLEAELAEAVGSPRFFPLARRRYPAGTASESAAARHLAEGWARLSSMPEPGPRHRSDDRREPESLVNLLTRKLEERRLPVRVEIKSALGSRAATGDGIIFVRAGELLHEREARRIAAHEILGHALPRVHARAQQVGLYRVGSAGAGADEEGRALHIEQRLELLDTERRIELGRRHLAALAVADGAAATECVRLLLGCGATPAAASSTYARVARGGGLCRELVYLPAWLRVQSALALDPELERWLSHGRLSIAAARTLRELGLTPVTTSLVPATLT